MIELSGISQVFSGCRVLDDIRISLPDQGVIALMGSSGAGKTCLLKIMAGLLRPSGGRITGMDEKRVCLMFQEDRLLPWCSAIENVLLAMPQADKAEAKRILECLAIENADALPSTLSGGMKRRVALARSIAFQPDVLLLDEPFSGVDWQTKKLIAPIVHKAAPLILFATHDRQEVDIMHSDQIMVLENGRLRLD